MWWSAIDGVLYQNLPPVAGLLQSIEIESNEIIEEVAFHLTTKDVNLAPENVESMAIASRRSWSRW